MEIETEKTVEIVSVEHMEEIYQDVFGVDNFLDSCNFQIYTIYSALQRLDELIGCSNVFYFTSDEDWIVGRAKGRGYWVVYETEDGQYYLQPVADALDGLRYGLSKLEDLDKIAAIKRSEIETIPLSDEELKRCDLAA